MARRTSVWDDDHRPYGAYKGQRGNATQWADAFNERMNPDEAREVLGGEAESAWSVLELKPGASESEVKTAYRKFAKMHHPDHGGDAEVFKRYHAAYSLLMENFR